MVNPRMLVAPCALAAVAACYRPDPPLGLPCSSELQCPRGQRCQIDAPGGPRCVSPTGDGINDGTDDAAVDAPEAVDAPDLLGPPNDRPEGAIDVSAGGLFAFDLSNAHDDAASSCAQGRPEVFFRLALAAPEVIYLDTFGSSVDTAIAIRSGACASAGSEEACADDSCGGAQSQGAWNLAAGEHCIVVEGPATSAGPGGQLVVVRGGHTGNPLTAASGSVTGDTCKDDNDNAAACGCEPGQDHHYFFTVCPGAGVSAHLETCNGATWDTVLQLRSGAGAGLACNDDGCAGTSSTLTRTVTGPGMFWAIIDGCRDCGVYTMAYSLTPVP